MIANRPSRSQKHNCWLLLNCTWFSWIAHIKYPQNVIICFGNIGMAAAYSDSDVIWLRSRWFVFGIAEVNWLNRIAQVEDLQA